MRVPRAVYARSMRTIRYGVTLPERLWRAVSERVERYRGEPYNLTINTFFARALEAELARSQDDHRDISSGKRSAVTNAARRKRLKKAK